MATPNHIVAFEGFNGYPDAAITQNFPWYTTGNPTYGRISSGAGAFPNAKGLLMDNGSAWTMGQSYHFPNGGTIRRSSANAEGNTLLGFSGWLRINTVAPSTSASTLVAWSNDVNTSLMMPIIGIINSPTNGLELLFPTTNNITNSPKKLSITTGVYYWVNCTLAVSSTGVVKASYKINNIPIHDDVTVTLDNDPLSTNLCNRLVFFGGASVCTYAIDDFVIQATNGGLSTWPSGFNANVPKAPALVDLPSITARRVNDITVVGNGTLNQWESSDEGTPNWQSAMSATKFVKATDSGQVDLYKFDVPDNIEVNDVLAVKVRASTSKYFSVDSAMKENSSAPVTSTPGVTTKGNSTIISVQEQTPSGEKWTVEKIEEAEFGHKSL